MVVFLAVLHIVIINSCVRCGSFFPGLGLRYGKHFKRNDELNGSTC